VQSFKTRDSTLYLSDCLNGMREMESNSIDSIVTDPPYGLEFMGKDWDKLVAKPKGRTVKMQIDKPTIEVRNDTPQHRVGIRQPAYLLRCNACGGNSSGAWNRCRCDIPDFRSRNDLGVGMQEWHYNWAIEAFRVLKPGGFLLSFGGTRTYHRMACAVEDVGFEMRDMVEWMYGSGFPKSLNIGKAIDKLQGNEREVIGEKKLWGHNAGSGPGSFSKNEYEGQTGIVRLEPLTKGYSEWEGWGTALKPAHEPICMARKPLSEKTVAENVLKWGTGGINVDGCRVGTNDELTHGGPLRTNSGDTRSGKALGMFQDGTPNTYKQSPQGRFPANLIHDGSEEVLACFPDSNGSGPARVLKRSAKPEQDGWGMNKNEPDDAILVDAGTGNAARFFYCAKASKAERDAGCENLEERFVRRDDGQPFGMNTNQYRPDGSERKSIPPRHNNHPTVKPLALMRYLCRLVTPPGGIILDPFMGSGSTGVAVELEGFRFIGIDQDKEAFDIACRRVSYVRLG